MNIINDHDRAGRVIRRCYSKPNISTSATNCVGLQENEISTDTPYVLFYYDGINLTNQPFAKGKLTKVTSSISETQNTMFDNFGRVTESKQITDGNTYTSKYGYSFTGALIQEEYPSGRIVKNEYESDGDIARIFGSVNSTTPEKTFANTFRYTPDGKIESLRLGNGLWESAKFNNRMQPTEINLGHGVVSGDLWKLTYDYGELETNGTVNTGKSTGNIARQTVSFNGLSHPFVQSYKYDALQRLTEAKETKNGSQTWLQQFGYDIYGNRNSTNQSVNGSTIMTTPAVDANTNRFTSTSFQYDKNGNITRDTSVANQSRTFLFNADNKQRQVLDANDNPIGTYYYDGEGKRVKKVTLAETTIYVFSGGKLVAEYTNTTPPSNPTVNYTATDLLGSPRVLTDSQGAVVSRRDFLPFGEEVYADGSNRTIANKYTTTGDDGLRKRFTGYEKDKETQLDFAEARMYENRYGRFTAVDPLLASGKSSNPQTFNRFVYVLNSPLRFSDPTGLQVAEYPDDGVIERVESTAFDSFTEAYNYMKGLGQSFLDRFLSTEKRIGTATRYYAYQSGGSDDYQGRTTNGLVGRRFDNIVNPTSAPFHQEFNRNMKKVESVVEKTPVFSSYYNYAKSLSTGDKKGAFLNSILIPVDMGSSVFGGGTTRQAVKTGAETGGAKAFNLALGLGGDLFDFAKSTNSTTYFHRYGKTFTETNFLKIATEAKQINFNVGGGFSFTRYAEWQKAKRPDGFNVFTNLELDTILSNPELRKKTNFFVFPSQ